jgi:hypothetical protein
LVQTAFTTSQSITNPGYLTTPIGTNQWTNIFTGFSDTTVKGKTQGFSEFVAVNLGATNAQGLGTLHVVFPRFPFTLKQGRMIPVEFGLPSVVNRKPINDAHASISVDMIADGNGNPTMVTVLSATNAFQHTSRAGVYSYSLNAAEYAAGTYVVTIYGDAFPAFQGQFVLQNNRSQGSQRSLDDENR